MNAFWRQAQYGEHCGAEVSFRNYFLKRIETGERTRTRRRSSEGQILVQVVVKKWAEIDSVTDSSFMLCKLIVSKDCWRTSV